MKRYCFLFQSSLVVLGLMLAHPNHSHAAIYGEDERINVSRERDQDWKRAARSVAVMMKASKIEKSRQKIKVTTAKKNQLKNSNDVCDGERFLDEPTHGLCTGFLVGSDLIMTARHCLPSIVSCKNFVWMFDYTDENLDESGNVEVREKDIYECKEILTHSTSRNRKHDFAVFRVNRKVQGRTPLKLEENYRGQIGDSIGMIGSPLGLPLKIARVGEILSEEDRYSFQVNVDTYGGNSGSPVFDSRTMKVLGILVAGEPDFVYSSTLKCNRSRRYLSERWKGERAYRVDLIDVQSEIYNLDDMN